MKNKLNQLGWFFYRLTPKGKRAWKFKKGFDGLLESNRLKTQAKANVISTAIKNMKKKKLIAFHKGKSISKPKQSDYQIKESVKQEHKEELSTVGIKITKKGKFRNA